MSFPLLHEQANAASIGNLPIKRIQEIQKRKQSPTLDYKYKYSFCKTRYYLTDSIFVKKAI